MDETDAQGSCHIPLDNYDNSSDIHFSFHVTNRWKHTIVHALRHLTKLISALRQEEKEKKKENRFILTTFHTTCRPAPLYTSIQK